MTNNSSITNRNVKVTDLLPQIILILGSIVILVLCQFLRKLVSPESRLAINILIPICLVLIFISVWQIEKGGLPRWMEKTLHKIVQWMNVSPWQIPLLVLGLLFGVLTCVAAGFSPKAINMPLSVICWGGSMFMVIFGGIKSFKPQKISTTVLIIGFAFFLVAFLVRAFNTSKIPIVLSGDEASSGLFSLSFLNGSWDNIFVTGWYSFPSFHNFLQSISISIFGQTTQALRLLSAFSGALSVVLVFFVGRSMFGTVVGVISALFLTGLHLALNFSRSGLNNIWDGFFLTLVIGCLWIGWQKNNRAAYLIAGFALGLSQYFYTTSRVLVLIIPLWILTASLSDRDRLKQSIPNLLLMFWVTLIVFLPLGWFFLKHPNEMMAPMNRVSILGNWMIQTIQQTGQPKIIIILKQIWLSLLGFVELPIRSWYEPGVPVLRNFSSIIFLLGLIFMVLHPKDNRNQIIFYWLIFIALSVGLSESAPAAQRYVAATPAIALIIGISLKKIGDLFLRFLPRAKTVISIVIIACGLLLSLDDARFYFLEYTPNSNFAGINGMIAQTLADGLKNEPSGQELVFCGYPNMNYNSINSLSYLAPHIIYFNMDENWSSADIAKPAGNRILFVFLPNHEKDIQLVESEYKGGSWSDAVSRKGELLYSLYEYNGLNSSTN